MKKLFYLGFCLVLAMGVGCAITNYPVIVDYYTGAVENTNGKALIANDSQVATIWSDGADNLFSMIDQKANGDGTLTTYNYYTTDGSYFIDFDYCSPDWNGCAIVTAPNGGDPFDRSVNYNCAGARSLSLFLSAARYGECGRLSVQEKGRLLDTLNTTANGLEGVISRHNTTAIANGSLVDLYGMASFTVSFGAGNSINVVVDMSGPLATMTADNFVMEHQGVNDISITYNGLFAGDYHVKVE
jgi:hypothetical protein